MLYATCLGILLHFHELIPDLPLSSIIICFTEMYALKKKWFLEGLHFPW